VTTDKNKKSFSIAAEAVARRCGVDAEKMGFKNVISLAGGYRGWMQSQL